MRISRSLGVVTFSVLAFCMSGPFVIVPADRRGREPTGAVVFVRWGRGGRGPSVSIGPTVQARRAFDDASDPRARARRRNVPGARTALSRRPFISSSSASSRWKLPSQTRRYCSSHSFARASGLGAMRQRWVRPTTRRRSFSRRA